MNEHKLFHIKITLYYMNEHGIIAHKPLWPSAIWTVFQHETQAADPSRSQDIGRFFLLKG